MTLLRLFSPIPSSDTMWPRCDTEVLKNSHFDGFSFRLCSATYEKTDSSLWMCSSKVLENLKMPSRKIKHFLRCISPKITNWKGSLDLVLLIHLNLPITSSEVLFWKELRPVDRSNDIVKFWQHICVISSFTVPKSMQNLQKSSVFLT